MPYVPPAHPAPWDESADHRLAAAARHAAEAETPEWREQQQAARQMTLF